ncbi:tol-pal system-associated acyl-CoA thioesterase [Dasania sp. GY-MA-18]|uniref:Tol-pal system-associated acyl-CoA thioesterase n=1 Tax=Dasania phycosphaerae TaxID=2950436 RepID=A0A9J6RGJ3_9GAMM|nr:MULTISPECIES: tol-pal system-associated acyl-CoA thioesterase [Dasania]MCR8921143.1 tol-pal system-associated acyl-CoA thioesterase [Dasania sp. GY-MA-18]MCZ0863571.1 tol-pal system-associated acyl-CoA thioesterase [Dasania phycosphaerae]MCZ0867299.1 tol-pal system-associated acyl-CoA thioesterase [Dasania phycosphaerae]
MSHNFAWPLRVYIEDTDAGGIVYYVNYLKFMERARTEYLRSLGFGKNYIFNAELMFVVQSVNTEYLKPAALDDELSVSATVIAAGACQLTMEQLIYRGSELLCRGVVKIVCVSQQGMNPKRIPKAMREALQL